ncbi:hypothetical protein [Sphingomonas sp. BAUL-RG-20F-R05-02]|uniref:hypothetical protein n=1 Tax=Sphingomonas sp. BAUL-RG-20F-R05-02 TaxID=2914830 RepID=UPI001F5AD0BB|nr:hypothetical protein [Sphingomonas sp. BAUL-RG-20F-R05-02]
MIGAIFLALAVACCGTAALLGGRDGRWVALLYGLAIVGTHYARLAVPTWASPHLPVFLVDLSLLVGLMAVALNSNRYWTIWIAGLHVLTVTSHASVWFVGSFDARAYFVMESVWSPVKLVILLLGVLLDWGRRHEA